MSSTRLTWRCLLVDHVIPSWEEPRRQRINLMGGANMISLRHTGAGLLGLAIILSVVGPTRAADTLTIAGFGGNLQADLRKTIWQPAAEVAGVDLREETHDGLAAVRVQVQSGSPTWDVVHLGADE